MSSTFAPDMLRSFTAIFLICTLTAANFMQLFIYAGFELNQSYIASVLCENKDKPMLNCNGKCYLAKKIKKAEENEKSQEQQSQKNRFQEASIVMDLRVKFYPQVVRALKIPVRHFDLPQFSSSIFHPPQV